MYMYSYDPHSESAAAVAKAVGLVRIKHTESKFRGDYTKTVLNWGSGDLPIQVRRCKIINTEISVAHAINKVKCFNLLKNSGVPTVPWTQLKSTVVEWLAEGGRVFARTKVAGKDGEGLKECVINDEIPHARLYTKFIPSVKEYRITCVGDGWVAQRKVPLDNFNGVLNPDIKTTSNGYGFKFVTLNIPDEVVQVSKDAIKALGLDFGGVDVLWTEDNKAMVLEVNTAPHTTPRAVAALAPHFKRLMGIQ